MGRNVETHDESCAIFSAACDTRKNEGNELIPAQNSVPQRFLSDLLSDVRNFGYSESNFDDNDQKITC